MSYGNKSFTGSLVKPLVNPAGSSSLIPPTTVVSGTETFSMDTKDAQDCSIQVIVGNISTAANTKSAPYAVAGSGAIQTTLTWVPVVSTSGRGSLGNNITVALIGGGTAGSEVITVTGSAIVAKIQSGTSTFTQVRTALNASAPAAALATFSGTSASTMTRTGTLATLVVQTNLTLTAVDDVNGVQTNGNNITLTLVAGGVAGSEVVTVVGNAISVSIAAGSSTITQVRTAMQAAPACTALVTTTGTSATAMNALAVTNLTGGITGVTATTGGADSSFYAGIAAANGLITVASTSVLWTGVLVQTPATSGSLPTGIAASTNYFAYVTSATTFQLFDTLAHALLAQALYGNGPAPASATGLQIITVDGTAGGSTLVTPTALSGCSYKLQGSNDYVPGVSVVGSGATNSGGLSNTGAVTALNAGNWFDLVSGESASALVTNTVTTASTTSRVSVTACAYAYVRILFATSAGSAQIQVVGHS